MTVVAPVCLKSNWYHVWSWYLVDTPSVFGHGKYSTLYTGSPYQWSQSSSLDPWTCIDAGTVSTQNLPKILEDAWQRQWFDTLDGTFPYFWHSPRCLQLARESFRRSDELHTSSPPRFCAVAARNMSAERILLSHAKSGKSFTGCWSTRPAAKVPRIQPVKPWGFHHHGDSNGHDAQEDSQEPSRSHGVTVDSVDFNWCTVRMQLETFEKTEGIAIDLGLLLFPLRFSWIRNLQNFSGQPTVHPCHLHLNSSSPEIDICSKHFSCFSSAPHKTKIRKTIPEMTPLRWRRCAMFPPPPYEPPDRPPPRHPHGALPAMSLDVPRPKRERSAAT